MKKLNLKNLELRDHDLLKREELKSVIGGYGVMVKCCWDSSPGSCSECGVGSTCVAGAHLVSC